MKIKVSGPEWKVSLTDAVIHLWVNQPDMSFQFQLNRVQALSAHVWVTQFITFNQ